MPILVSAGQARSPKGQQVCIAGPVDGVPLGVPKKCWHQETEGQGGGAMACGGRGVGGGRQADWATISFLVFWGLTVLLPGHRGHTGPGADPARSRGGERSATCHPPPPPPPRASGPLPAGGHAVLHVPTPRSGHPHTRWAGQGAWACAAACTGLLSRAPREPGLVRGVCAWMWPCLPRILPGSSLYVCAHA